MGKIYKNQTKLILKLNANQDITGATSTPIKYRKPSGVFGELAATIDDALLGIIKFSDFVESTLDEAGDWKFWSYVVFADGKKAAGEPINVTIYNVGC